MHSASRIWQSNIGHMNDKNEKHRDQLRTSYESFRANISQLIQSIPQDCEGLTVHDISHLDALWSMGDILTGGEYDLNPAEIYVLGGAILLHDSAMTIAAYKGGVDEIKQTPEYLDAITLIENVVGNSIDEKEQVEAEKLALFEALRVKHAAKAEELATQAWRSPLDGKDYYLISDVVLRSHYARTIGKIAHSHHWDIDRVVSEFDHSIGAVSEFPAEWKVDQLKIALLLRCIDAMHIDDRRAPTFLSAISKIGKSSQVHWKFQNKLTQPHIADQLLTYTAKEPFTVDEAEAWNLCFDTIQMIDKELSNAKELHVHKSLPEFKASGVAGANSAEALSKYIYVKDWKPLPLSLVVSDVSKLALTLGGKDLYNYPYAPLRELIQNAADAIEARVALDPDFHLEDGLINIRIYPKNEKTMLEVEDNGVGMSERVIKKALLDFGFSFWKSAEARSEFPGLQSSTGKLRGKYGIGFFSVFMWSSKVLVSSRLFSEGVNETKVLEFNNGLNMRPILRNPTSKEKSSRWSTKVLLELNDDNPINKKTYELPESDEYLQIELEEWEKPKSKTLEEILKLLCGALNIKVVFDNENIITTVSKVDWTYCTESDFLEFFGGVAFVKNPFTDNYINTLTPILDNNNTVTGRCFISPSARGYSSTLAVYDKGIFVTSTRWRGVSGVVLSNVSNAARDQFIEIEEERKLNWLTNVAPKGFNLAKNFGEELYIQSLLVNAGIVDENKILFLMNRKFLSLNQLVIEIKRTKRLLIVLGESGVDEFEWTSPREIGLITGLHVNEDIVYPLIDDLGEIESEDKFVEGLTNSSMPLFFLLRLLISKVDLRYEFDINRLSGIGYLDDSIDVQFQFFES